jgi:hypothetical protein
MRICAKLGCRSRASVTAALRYGDREVLVGDLTEKPDPNLVDLCTAHALGLRPPIGWSVVDVRRAVPAPA